MRCCIWYCLCRGQLQVCIIVFITSNRSLMYISFHYSTCLHRCSKLGLMHPAPVFAQLLHFFFTVSPTEEHSLQGDNILCINAALAFILFQQSPECVSFECAHKIMYLGLYTIQLAYFCGFLLQDLFCRFVIVLMSRLTDLLLHPIISSPGLEISLKKVTAKMSKLTLGLWFFIGRFTEGHQCHQ